MSFLIRFIPQRFRNGINIPQFKCEIKFLIKSALQSRVIPDYYFSTFNADDKNNECEKPGKHFQKKRQQIELTHFNKLSPSTPAENCHNLVYWFIRKKHPHVSPLWGKIWENCVSSAILDIFGVLFSYKIQVYNIYLPTPLKSSSSWKSFFRFTGESLEVAIHLNDIFLLIKKTMCDWLCLWKTGFLQSTRQ